MLFGRVGHTFSPVSGREVRHHTVEDVLAAVTTTNLLRGISTSMFLRLLTRAPFMVMLETLSVLIFVTYKDTKFSAPCGALVSDATLSRTITIGNQGKNALEIRRVYTTGGTRCGSTAACRYGGSPSTDGCNVSGLPRSRRDCEHHQGEERQTGRGNHNCRPRRSARSHAQRPHIATAMAGGSPRMKSHSGLRILPMNWRA